MSTTLTPIITNTGITALVDAKNRGMQARITHVAVGDGLAGAGSGPYTATASMTALNHEIQRVIVSGGEQIGSLQNQLHLTATVQDEGVSVPTVYPIYEIGFFLETGELFAIYASPTDKLAEKVSGTDFLLAFDLTFTGVAAGDVVIDGRSQLETPAACDNILLGSNTIKIHSQAEFDKIFNQGADTVIAANSTIALSPIQDTYQAGDTGRWQRLYDITALADSTTSPGTKVTCTATAHGLSDGDSIFILQSQYHDGNYSVSNVSTNSFDTLATFVATGSAKWGAIIGGVGVFTGISAFADSSTAPGTRVICTSTAHGLSDNETILLSQSHYYSGVYTVTAVDTVNHTFDIDTPYISANLDGGAWGGTGDAAENTFNGRPAYILKNSIILSEYVSIIGFNQEDTLLVKDNGETKIKVIGTSGSPITGIQLRGWSFDGRGGVGGLGGALTGASNGGAFSLDYCEDSALNCKIINHSTSANGGGLYGTNNVKQITATQLHHNSAANGGGAVNCDDSTFTVYNCSATTSGSGVEACDNALLRLFNCEAANSTGGVVVEDNGKVGIGTATPQTTLDVNGDAQISGDISVNGTLNFDVAIRQMINLWDDGIQNYGIGVQADTQYFRTGKNFAWYKEGGHDDNVLNAGTGGIVQMVINDGKVGIGTTNPGYPLHVESGTGNNTSNFRYMCLPNTNLAYYNGPPWTGTYSISATYAIKCDQFHAVSDQRIKQIEHRSNAAVDLATLLNIEVTDYTYIDKLQHGNTAKKGLIAQQVEQLFPQAVNHSTDFIPDIFTLSSATEYQANQSSLSVQLTDSHDLQVGDKVRLIALEQGRVDKEVIAVAKDGLSFTVGDWETEVDKVFVYGKQVDDFRTIDYDRILMLCISALQVHDQQHKQLQKEKYDLEVKVDSLQQGYDDLKAGLAALKNA